MVNTELNHVSVLADDIDESTEFYTDVIGLEPVPTANFEVPVQWLEGEYGQIHLFEREMEAVPYYHFGVTVDDFEAVYQRAKENNFLANWDDGTDASIYELPDGAAQMYLNDPTGNLLEVNYPDVDELGADLREEIVDRDELQSQTGEAARATLGLAPVGETTAN